jgi:hypothetical protein
VFLLLLDSVPGCEMNYINGLLVNASHGTAGLLLCFCSAGLLAVCVTAHSLHVVTVLLACDIM